MGQSSQDVSEQKCVSWILLGYLSLHSNHIGEGLLRPLFLRCTMALVNNDNKIYKATFDTYNVAG